MSKYLLEAQDWLLAEAQLRWYLLRRKKRDPKETCHRFSRKRQRRQVRHFQSSHRHAPAHWKLAWENSLKGRGNTPFQRLHRRHNWSSRNILSLNILSRGTRFQKVHSRWKARRCDKRRRRLCSWEKPILHFTVDGTRNANDHSVESVRHRKK